MKNAEVSAIHLCFNCFSVNMVSIESKGQLTDLIRLEKAVIVYFFSNKCAPCMVLRPKIIHLADKDFPLCKIAFIDSEKFPDIAAEFNVFASPTILLFFEGKENHRFSKYIGLNELSSSLARPYKLIFH